tara:strand:- start:1652 stop:2125 length:474 start_codon:yes stop_codon:yes gene_type:complete
MHEYHIHTLIDITDNGNLKQQFPFKTKSGDIVHDKHSLAIARNQNSNFNTMLQLLQMRGNIVWESSPMRLELQTLGNHKFGTFYEGKQTTWHFQFFTEQSGVYGDDIEPTAFLKDDFHHVPIVSFCKETATFPLSTFDTQEYKTINTYFSYAGPSDK